MDKNNIWILSALIIMRIVIIPIASLAFNLILASKMFGFKLGAVQILYLASISRLVIYTLTRTIKSDWRD